MSKADERAEEACGWLAGMPGGQATPGEVGAALGLNHARQAETVKAMRAAGYVDGARTLTLTALGWERFGSPLVDADGAGEVLEQALVGWPQSHRAFVELLASAVVARHHLGEREPSGHLGFMALGETGTGKSAAARLVCDVFGWDPAAHELHTPAESAGSLLGRRLQTEGGYVWEAAAVTRLPFVFLDELDKADEATARRAMVYLHGERRHQAEGQVHELLPVAMVAANPPRTGDRYAALRPEYRRRSAVLDTGAMQGRGYELEQVLERYYGTLRRPRLSLDALRPPAVLPEDARAVLESVRHVLTDAGRSDFPGGRTLALATRGRMALLGDGADAAVAAYLTACAYLQVTETVPGLVVPGWQDSLARVREVLGTRPGVEQLVAALERGTVEREESARAIRRARTQRASADMATAEQGATLAARLQRMHEALDGRRLQTLSAEQRDQAKGLRRTLRTLGESASRVRTPRALEEVQDQAEDPVRRAEALVTAEAAERARVEREARQAREAAAQERAWAKQAEAEQRRVRQAHEATARAQRLALQQQARETLEQIAREAKPLEALYRRTTTQVGESPLETLAALRVGGRPVLRFQALASDSRGVWGVLAGAVVGETGTWMIAGTSHGLPGTRTSCVALARWGEGTRSVLAPMLRHLHEQEDELCARIGRQPRANRPNVSAAAAARHGLPVSTGGYHALPAPRR